MVHISYVTRKGNKFSYLDKFDKYSDSDNVEELLNIIQYVDGVQTGFAIVFKVKGESKMYGRYKPGEVTKYYLELLNILPQYRSQGFGRAFVKYLKQRFIKLYFHIDIETSDVDVFWRKMGARSAEDGNPIAYTIE